MFDCLRIKETESTDEYIYRLSKYKDLYNLSWQDVADLVGENTGYFRSESYYRKKFKKYLDNYNKEFDYMTQPENEDVVEENNELNEIKLERYKLRDEINQLNNLTRLKAREDSLKEYATEIAEKVASKKKLIPPTTSFFDTDKQAILCVGDWHYGLEVDIPYTNKYSPEIARNRVSKLEDEVKHIISENEINRLIVVNLGDMISGRIHLPLRVNSRMDAVTQTMEVSEILAEFLSDLAHEIYEIDYYSVLDNHSRVEPKKKESLQTETFARIIDWYLKERLRDNTNINFKENKFGDDIASFKIYEHKVLAVHGDKDKQRGIIKSLNSYTQDHYDLILSAHRHHFSADEENGTEFYCNGSLIGTDDYANGLRLNSSPSQLLIISDRNNITNCIYKIKLN